MAHALIIEIDFARCVATQQPGTSFAFVTHNEHDFRYA